MAPRLWVGPTNSKQSAVGRLITLFKLGRPAWTPRQYDKLADEAYVRNVVGYRCVRMIAEAAAGVPWLVYDNGKEQETHPVIDLLEAPNPMQGGPEFWDAYYSFLQIAGNSYIEAVALGKTQIDEMYVLRPDRMKVLPGPKGWPIGYEYSVEGRSFVYNMNIGRKDQAPILHMKLFHPTDDFYGMSPVEAAAFSVDIHNAASGFNKALLDNSARPSGALQTDKELSEPQHNRLKSELEENISGAANAGKPLLLEGGLKWQNMSLSPSDLDFINGKRDAARDVALGFGVPPQLLGIPGDNTYSNYAEAQRAFYRQAVLPLVDRTCGRLSVWLRPTYGKTLKIGYDADNLEALAPERKELWDRLRFSEDLTVNEKRVAKGYEKTKDPNGDKIIIRTNFMLLDDIDVNGMPPAPAKPAGKSGA